MKWVSKAEQPLTSLRSPCAMPRVGWIGVKLMMNHASPSGSPTIKSVFGRRTLPARMYVPTVKFGGGGIMVWAFFMGRASPLSSSEGKS